MQFCPGDSTVVTQTQSTALKPCGRRAGRGAGCKSSSPGSQGPLSTI